MKSVVFAAAALAVSGFACPAMAQAGDVVTEVTQSDLASFAEAEGHTVTQRGEDPEAPTVQAQTEGGMLYYLVGNACEAGSCRGIKLIARFAADDQVTSEKVNQINRDVPPLKLWYDDSGLSVERYIILNRGVTRDNIVFELSTFDVIVQNVIDRFRS
ncbi:YbjN domain-containing protein [Henriciella aquimarina]|uniref:YbjN domain-containing protein n=1 Tax=Henriciella aquimarina TaxID=545261 RepID=UPI000A01816D|nr:YbjN domain-containing protein [Henriciella aquimarina]